MHWITVNGRLSCQQAPQKVSGQRLILRRINIRHLCLSPVKGLKCPWNFSDLSPSMMTLFSQLRGLIHRKCSTLLITAAHHICDGGPRAGSTELQALQCYISLAQNLPGFGASWLLFSESLCSLFNGLSWELGGNGTSSRSLAGLKPVISGVPLIQQGEAADQKITSNWDNSVRIWSPDIPLSFRQGTMELMGCWHLCF